MQFKSINVLIYRLKSNLIKLIINNLFIYKAFQCDNHEF